MQISKRSWHYRMLVVMRSDSTPPDNLCAYVRSAFVFGFICLLVSPLIALVAAWLWLEPYVDRAGDKLIDALPRLKDRPPKAERPESLWRAWLRAKHEKVCPVIEFND